MNGYEELANAIILQAVKDYREALRLLSMNPNDKSAKRDQRNIERFFRSEWFSILSDLPKPRLFRPLLHGNLCF